MAPAKRGKKDVSARAVTKSMSKVSVEEDTTDVFLFVPNLIGYARVILAAISLYYMRDNPKVCTVLYCVSCMLDAFDGMFARRLDQATKFGAVLDMVTDRCTTSSLLCFLTAAYPRCALLFQGLITLDFSSHYIHMYTTLVAGSKSHKIVDSEVSKILSLYYTDNRVLFIFCACNEIFFVCLYLMDFYKQPLELQIAPLLPHAMLKAIYADRNGLFYHAIFYYIPSLTWPQILGAVTLPICAMKQAINAVQFWKAAKRLAEIDCEERSQRRAKHIK
ncbi:CDP-diacylglycerol--inositol 3-phosphatidyltransferase [Malassezia vespertilionis]|uniref:CDP-diacylglycerol--inositol 3-phosphatidyltransferase n=1 Tax=Malassezia vespertilionis TaxID=2020962 RepID=UPI0024B065D4|nr:CDP-diacylglycerol--inositol 3-phosphatidyltransferase [Malassezia vespertilionis]WFD06843.1 CDP-diacylglycerol--inositol 3-phosphatidyltransferase [Malassezia vespertilionis]